jgi:hypothetical protein
MGGIAVPDTPLITAALEYAHELYELYLFNHSIRSWLFAAKIGQLKGIDCDLELVAVGTILHDIGLTAGVPGSNRFEVNGAEAALSFVKERGVSGRRAQLIWDLVALNSTPSILSPRRREAGDERRQFPARFWRALRTRLQGDIDRRSVDECAVRGIAVFVVHSGHTWLRTRQSTETRGKERDT